MDAHCVVSILRFGAYGTVEILRRGYRVRSFLLHELALIEFVLFEISQFENFINLV